MNRRIQLYKIVCYVNLLSVSITVALLLYRLRPILFTEDGDFNASGENLWVLIILFSITAIYCVNFFLGMKLFARFHKGIDDTRFNNGIRILFFILEIMATLLYSLGIYEVIGRFRIDGFWQLKGFELFTFIIFMIGSCFGWVSSLIRIFLTPYVLKRSRVQLRSDIDFIGED